MENWRLNWSVIRPDLVIGSGPRDPNDLDVLQVATGASTLLSLQHDDCLEQQAIELDTDTWRRAERAVWREALTAG